MYGVDKTERNAIAQELMDLLGPNAAALLQMAEKDCDCPSCRVVYEELRRREKKLRGIIMLLDAELREISQLSRKSVEAELATEMDSIVEKLFGQAFVGQVRKQREATRRVEVRQVDSLEELMRLLSGRK